jgi:hypothetical protein
MNRTAYVICFFRPMDGVPVFKGAGIYSERATSLTIEGDLIPMDVLQGTGNNYEEARASAIETIRSHGRYSWLVPHLRRDGV